MAFWSWSRTAASNATADTSINWAEGQSPSSVNDSARAMMAGLASYRDDIAGAITSGGTSTAYTVSSYESFDTLAHMNGAQIAFTPHTTNGATVTLAVDGLTAVPLRSAPSTEIGAGVLVQGTPYVALYNNSTTEFILRGLYGNPYNVPLGVLMEYTGTTAPNSNFVLPYGQAISRTTYSTYFSMVGTTFGVGDGVNTFNVIDKRGRVSAGKDDMGGSAASRITFASSSITGSTLGSVGGAQAFTLLQANLPNVTLATTIAAGQGSHSHVDGSEHGNTAVGGSSDRQGISSPPHSTSAATLPAMSGTTPTGGSDTPVVNMQPTVIVNYILRIF